MSQYYDSTPQKDEQLGGIYQRNGISCEGGVKMTINKVPSTRTDFIVGETFKLEFLNVQGFVRNNGYVDPIMEIAIVDPFGKVIHSNPDLLANVNPKDFDDPKFTVFYRPREPFSKEQNYRFLIILKDKNSNRYFNYILPFSVSPNSLLKLDDLGLSSLAYYVHDEQQDEIITQPQFNVNNTMYIYFGYIQGLTIKDGRVYPVVPVDVINSQGKVVISSPNVFSNVQHTGLHLEEVMYKYMHVNINFDKGDISNPYLIRIRVMDGLDTRKQMTLELETDLHY